MSRSSRATTDSTMRALATKSIARIRKLLTALSSGTVFTARLGNHDESSMAYELENIGINMLVNDSAQITRGRDSIWLAGIDDSFDYKADDLPGALADVPRMHSRFCWPTRPIFINRPLLQAFSYTCAATPTVVRSESLKSGHFAVTQNALASTPMEVGITTECMATPAAVSAVPRSRYV